MYKLYPSLVLGFHACDQSVGESVLSGKAQLKRSENKYDWLGHGIYFWENSPERAREWGTLQKARGKIRNPCVVGAVIALGRCFDLLQSESLAVLRSSYDGLIASYKSAGIEHTVPKNEPVGGSEDLLLRMLDCAVIEFMHSGTSPTFDSVRGAFWEGDALYPGAGFKQKNHVQICVRNPNCIKGYFRPLDAAGTHPLV